VDGAKADRLAAGVMDDYRAAGLPAADVAMLDFAVKLTQEPSAMTRGDVEVLRAHGFDDDAVHEIVQIAAMFNYYNRLADGLGIDPEPDWDVAGGGGAPRS
jgi:uncharacterized peroxidase-related enzyme